MRFYTIKSISYDLKERYKTDDHNWKSVKTLLHLLVDLGSKGVNYLLNIGPRAMICLPLRGVCLTFERVERRF